jgi:hypothetical protein
LHNNFNKIVLNINGVNTLISKDSIEYKSGKYKNANKGKWWYINNKG